jgi:hypothetical protein
MEVIQLSIYYVYYRHEYEHPLIVSNVRRKAVVMGIEVKTVNDWEQFIEDKNV